MLTVPTPINNIQTWVIISAGWLVIWQFYN